ncbi:CHAT domain-containing protein [Flavisphingomonas formosensis]|uniref:CHAT domain-containing protein n=1 Tax=Flavisphingomonas formosensis TaxID=861534 RepID=UPI001E579CDC|nr:CHAT domain-containing protein [Sphingomonas formosensis]
MRIVLVLRHLAVTAGLAGTLSVAAAQGSTPPSLRDSFHLGSGGGALCQMQSAALDPGLRGMFDRSWSIVCRDAAVPVGQVYALRTGVDDPIARLDRIRQAKARCEAPSNEAIEDLGTVATQQCVRLDADVTYRVHALKRGRTVYVAEGLGGYDSALQLGLRTIVADRFLPGSVSVATTEAGDAVAFARVQAGSLDSDQVRTEGYRRNNSGNYAEAAEFFDTLLQRSGPDDQRAGEYLVNRALQQSNLGRFEEADALFARAKAIPTADPVQLRLRRNLGAIHQINQGRPAEALAQLDAPLTPRAPDAAAVIPGPQIDAAMAAAINTGLPMARPFAGSPEARLTPEEKAALLDAQALALRGTALRLEGRLDEAQADLGAAIDRLVAVREGKVISIVRLRAQTMAELSAVAEAKGDRGRAETLLRDALVLLQGQYPQSAAVNGAKARLAAFLARTDRAQAALALYREVVSGMVEARTSTLGMENLLAPYFALLVDQMPAQPALVDDFFLASETLVRPGVAETQAMLARQLGGGSDEAARLFRQAVNLGREVERTRMEIAQLAAQPALSPQDTARLDTAKKALVGLQADQVATQAKLADFPRYRALANDVLTLAELRETLKGDEAYFKLAVIGDAVYGLYATHDGATAYRAAISTGDLEKQVNALRETIAVVENGQLLTYPFDVKLAHGLYVALTGPVADRIAATRNLIFEPDGAMLRLPIGLLVTDQASVDAYASRGLRPGASEAEEFNFTDIAWLARRTDISTAVSAKAFKDVRSVAPAAGAHQYLGFGHNAPVSAFLQLTAVRPPSADGMDCNWPLANWNHPIPATELLTAQSIIGRTNAQLVTDAAFTDTGVKQRPDLAQYRILHFATHGLVTAPRPECPARPALLTSFGSGDSDGLLSFREIYDLHIDADLVILSACDTAGTATIAATREAGVTSGGGDALDGLVRAFIGAGGRSVLASHWPAPDNYNATERLVGGLFHAPAGTSAAEALRLAELKLMADPNTSHPYYWAGFALIGDGSQPIVRAR